MNDLLQPGQHPDADQLSAFAEHALPPHEQQQTLAHLASCADCRAVVFLAGQADPAESPQPVASRRPWFLGWNLAWPAAAALACLILLTLHLHNAGVPSRPAAVTTTASVEPPPPPLSAAPSPTAPAARPKPEPASKQPLATGALSAVSHVAAPQVAISPVAVPQSAAASQSAVSQSAISQDASALAPQQRLFRNYGQSSLSQTSTLHSPIAAPQPPVTLSVRSAGGAIDGLISDRTGAFIPHAKVTATNTLTGVQVTRESVNNGSFSISPLQPGTYTVEAVAQGFQRQLQENVQVGALQKVGLNMKLSVGAESATVTVTDAPPSLETANASLGLPIENRNYANLPQAKAGALRPPLTPSVQAAAAPPPAAPPAASPNETYIAGAALDALSDDAATAAAGATAFGNAKSGGGAGGNAAIVAKMAKPRPTLPSHLPALAVVANARHTLALDTAGALFRSEDAGVTWRPIAAQWTGRALTLRVAPSASPQATTEDKASSGAASAAAGRAVAAPLFELTTDSSAVWTSSDGQTWKRK